MINKPIIYSTLGSILEVTTTKARNIEVYPTTIKPKSLRDSKGLDLEHKFGVTFTKPNKRVRFDDYNPIILVGGTLDQYWNKHGDLDKDQESIYLEREVFNALQEGKTIFLIFEIDELFGKILHRSKIRFNGLGKEHADLTVHQLDFEDLIKKFGATRNSFVDDFEKIISKLSTGEVAGFSKKLKKGSLAYIPCNMSYDDFEKLSILDEFLPCLLKAIKKFQLRIQYEEPKWVETFRFTQEIPIVSKVTELRKKLEKNRSILAEYSEMKKVLWVRDDDIIDFIINMLDSLGLKCKRDEQFKEDFWIMKEETDEIIVEVKALDKNLKRPHISQLDLHRGSRDKLDDFPAVLIVNSFNNAESLKEKNKPISPAEIKKAVQLNVLIIRTLDLCNAFSLIKSGKLTSNKFFDLLKTKHGWLKVNAEDWKIETK